MKKRVRLSRGSGEYRKFSWLLAFIFAFGHASPESGVGTLDHVRILVRDIHATRSFYVNKLGFASPVKEPIVYPEGSVHDGAQSGDGQWIEWIGDVDREKVSNAHPGIVNFIEKSEDVHSVGMRLSVAEDIALRLKSAGIEYSQFRLVRKEGLQPVRYVTPKMSHLPDGAIFFVQYSRRKPPMAVVTQPN